MKLTRIMVVSKNTFAEIRDKHSIEMTEKELLPKIHHAGLPDEIASRDFKYQDSWEIGIDEFQDMKKKSA